MNLATLLVLTALVASLVLVAQSAARLFPFIALAASGLEALLTFRVISVSVSGIDIGFVLALCLLVAGAVSWMRTTGKSTVTAATAVALVGAVQVAGTLV